VNSSVLDFPGETQIETIVNNTIFQCYLIGAVISL
jgi:hypothetical protein